MVVQSMLSSESIIVTRPVKINHVSAKNRRFFHLLYHNLQTIDTKNYFYHHTAEINGRNLWKWNTTFRAEDISRSTTRCKLRSHG